MTHMLRALDVRSFVGRFGATAATEFPWPQTAPLLDFSGFDSHRAKMEAQFARLILVFEKQANVRFDENCASFRAGQLLEKLWPMSSPIEWAMRWLKPMPHQDGEERAGRRHWPRCSVRTDEIS